MIRDGRLLIDVISVAAYIERSTMVLRRVMGFGAALHIGQLSFSQLRGRALNQSTTASAYAGPLPVGSGGPR